MSPFISGFGTATSGRCLQTGGLPQALAHAQGTLAHPLLLTSPRPVGLQVWHQRVVLLPIPELAFKESRLLLGMCGLRLSAFGPVPLPFLHLRLRFRAPAPHLSLKRMPAPRLCPSWQRRCTSASPRRPRSFWRSESLRRPRGPYACSGAASREFQSASASSKCMTWRRRLEAGVHPLAGSVLKPCRDVASARSQRPGDRH